MSRGVSADFVTWGCFCLCRICIRSSQSGRTDLAQYTSLSGKAFLKGNLGVRPVAGIKLGNLGVRPVAGIKLAETVDAGQRDYGHVRRGREPAFCRPLCVLAASRLCVDVCSTCSSWRPERLTGSYPSGCRLRVRVEAGRNAADGTTERACYFAAVCIQLHILSPRVKHRGNARGMCGGHGVR